MSPWALSVGEELPGGWELGDHRLKKQGESSA